MSPAERGPILFKDIDTPGLTGLDVYRSGGGYEVLARMLGPQTPDACIEVVKASGLRGRGGAGAYICGEETALLSSLEGYRGQPRLKPPFPAVEGLYRCPTVVNNVETLMNVPHILAKGAAWFRQWGTEKSPGAKVFSVSGPVKRPGNVEVPMGLPLRRLIDEHCGGMRDGMKIKA